MATEQKYSKYAFVFRSFGFYYIYKSIVKQFIHLCILYNAIFLCSECLCVRLCVCVQNLKAKCIVCCFQKKNLCSSEFFLQILNLCNTYVRFVQLLI